MPNVTNVALRNGNGTADIKCLIWVGSQRLCGSEPIPQNTELQMETGCAGREVPAEEVPSATTLPCPSPPLCSAKASGGSRRGLQPGESGKHQGPLKGRTRSGTPRRREMKEGLESRCCIKGTSRSAPQINGRQETWDRISIKRHQARLRAGLRWVFISPMQKDWSEKKRYPKLQLEQEIGIGCLLISWVLHFSC